MELPGEIPFAENYLRRGVKFKYYWSKDETGVSIVLRKSIDNEDIGKSNLKQIKGIEEAFFVVPFNTKNNRCYVHFITNFNYGISSGTFIHKICENQIKLHRLELLSGFRAFMREQEDF